MAVDKLRPFTKRNVTTFVDSNGDVIAKASPNNAHGENCILVYPSKRVSGENLIMMRANYNGEVISSETDINALSNFKKHFLAAIQADKARSTN